VFVLTISETSKAVTPVNATTRKLTRNYDGIRREEGSTLVSKEDCCNYQLFYINRKAHNCVLRLRSIKLRKEEAASRCGGKMQI
jgi:hypothetical protein